MRLVPVVPVACLLVSLLAAASLSAKVEPAKKGNGNAGMKSGVNASVNGGAPGGVNASNKPVVSLPKAYPLSRYEGTWRKSPFNLETPVPSAPVVQSFAKDYALAGVSVIGEDKVAYLINRKTKKYVRVTTTKNKEGFILDQVKTDPDYRKSKVVVAKGSQKATLQYDQALVASRAPKKPVVNRGPSPGARNPSNQSGNSAILNPPAANGAGGASAESAKPSRTIRRRVIIPPSRK